MLTIGRALMTNPKLLFLDEATEGLAPLTREEIRVCLRHIREEGLSIVVVDKNIADLMHLAEPPLHPREAARRLAGIIGRTAGIKDVRDRYLDV